MKDGFLTTLDYSEARVNDVLKQLVQEGWLQLEHDCKDGRNRRVLATAKLVDKFDAYRRLFWEMIEGD